MDQAITTTTNNLPPTTGAEEQKTNDDVNDDDRAISFVTGNPRVEILRGKLHLYRENHQLTIDQVGHEQEELCPMSLLCIVSIPSHMSSIELLEFTSAYRNHMLFIRLMKDPELNRCMALIQFTTDQIADEFYNVRMWFIIIITFPLIK